MAITFKLKYGDPSSWSYIDLTDSSHGNSGYVPEAPGEGAEELTESGTFWIRGTSVSDLITKVRAIEDVFRRAAEFELEGIGANQVFLTGKLADTETTWESPIYEGRMDLPDDAFASAWANMELEVTITWRRAAYWETYQGLTEANTNTTEFGTIVFEGNDGSGSAPNKRINWLTITDTILGDLPAPAIFDLTLQTGSPSIDKILICQMSNAAALDGHYTFEGETGSGDTDDAARSGGKYHTYTVTTGTDIEWTHAHLSTLTTGAWLRCLLSAKINGTVKLTPYIKVNGVKYFGPASVVTAGGTIFGLYDLGMIHFPSINLRTFSFTGYTAIYYGIRMVAATSMTVGVDYANFIPVDSFMTVNMDGLVVAEKVVEIDCVRDMAYSWTGATIDFMGKLQGKINFLPGASNYLYFMMIGSGEDNLAAEAAVSAACWYRKKTL